MCHQPKDNNRQCGSGWERPKKCSHVSTASTLTNRSHGHMVTCRMAQPAVTVPLGCRYGSRRKQAEEEESVFSPSVLLAPVHEAGRGNLRNFARAARVICAQCREGDGPKTTQAVSFFFKAVERCSKWRAVRTFRNVPPLCGRIFVFHPKALACFFRHIFFPWIVPKNRNARGATAAHVMTACCRDKNTTESHINTLLDWKYHFTGDSTTLRILLRHLTQQCREINYLLFAEPVLPKPQKHVSWHLEKMWTCSKRLPTRICYICYPGSFKGQFPFH